MEVTQAQIMELYADTIKKLSGTGRAELMVKIAVLENGLALLRLRVEGRAKQNRVTAETHPYRDILGTSAMQRVRSYENVLEDMKSLGLWR